MNHGWRRQSGLTLTELVIVGSLLTVISSVALEFFIRQYDFLQTSTAHTEVRTQAQLALDVMLQELRHGTRADIISPPNISIPAEPGNTQLTFYRPTDLDANGLIIDAAGDIEWDITNPIQYVYVPALRQLQRVAGAVTRVIANDVQSVAFEDNSMDASLNPDEVRVSLTIQKATPRGRTVSTATSAVVTLRN